MDTRRNLPLQFELAEKKERSAVKDFAGKMKKSVATGLKGGVVGASAATTKGVVTGATTAAIGKLAATGIGGAIAGTGVGAAVLGAAPLIAGFSAACIVGTAIKAVIDGKETAG